MDKKQWVMIIVIVFIILIIFVGTQFFLLQTARQYTLDALAPLQNANLQLKTQVANILNPTPTIVPDPVTIIHEIRSLARLETIQYSIEKIITAEVGQGAFSFLLGDKLLFVGHGTVIAGVDLAKMTSADMYLEGNTLYV
ncbi:MAG: DUF4230 domain-containing protein, partial [Anaerolineae bacterium]|nr:DUF4230 domain-containing protein [Anaerolineae bacterium]